MASTETKDLEEMPSSPQPLIAQDFLAGQIPTLIINLIHEVLARRSEVLDDVPGGDSSRNEECHRVKEERKCLMESLNKYKIWKLKLGKKLLQKEGRHRSKKLVSNRS